MFPEDEILGPKDQVEADKEEDRRRKDVPYLHEPPVKRAVQERRGRGDSNIRVLVHATTPGDETKTYLPSEEQRKARR
jgi:hypothetical protein